jgi:hypothetical protein
MKKETKLQETTKTELKNLPKIQPLTEQETSTLKGGLCCADKRRPVRIRHY